MRRALWLAIGISLVPAVAFAQVQLEGDGPKREGEYGGVEPGGTANPLYEFERQCGNRDHRKGRLLREAANGESQVLKD